jgi:thiol:disulfide interchange protein
MLRILFVLSLLCCPALARAAQSNSFVSPRDTVTLLSDSDTATAAQGLRLGLRFELADGWHIYFRNPGDAGLPAELDWQLPPGMTIGDIEWPAPRRLSEGSLVTFGYTGAPMLMVPAKGSGGVKLHASWLICHDICVPEEADFALDIRPGKAAPSAEAKLFQAAQAQRPIQAPFSAKISDSGVLAVTGEGLASAAPRDAWFAPDDNDVILAGQGQTLRLLPDGFSLAMTPGPAFKPGQDMSGVLTVIDAGGQRTALGIAASPGEVAAATGIWRALLFALLGGLLLNLMPCVFPVLAMKAMAILRLSGGERSHARREALYYAAGVIASFAAIGGAVLSLRRLGHAVGWGFQFQSPWFVAFMAWLLFAVGLNLSGVFDVSGRYAGIGQGFALRAGSLGSFFAGVLAVLVATPCTAPFMSVALAAALTAPAMGVLALFVALGIGLAAPALLLAAAPGLAHGLPRPGRWMDIVRQALAFPVYGAAAWLIWVLAAQSGAGGVMIALAGLVGIALLAWLVGLGGRVAGRLAVAVLLLLIIGVSQATMPSAAPGAVAKGSDRFSATRLTELRAQHRPVLIDMTAAWCVTCLVNERVALRNDRVAAALASKDVAVLVGDWTRQDRQITDYLRSQGRDGVPLYVYYPAKGDPQVLPQILTPDIVLDALGS